jgi:hypothetical protein
MVQERRLRGPAVRRNRRKTVPGAAGSGEGFAQPGGVSDYGRRGERQRGDGATYRRRERSKRAGIE